MPATPSKKILVLAEGFMERLFVNANFKFVELIPLLNGKSWSSEKMCEQIGTKYSSKNIHASKIIVWLDQESHSCDSTVFREMIIEELVSRGAKTESIHICIPNKMTENIILSDELVIQSEFDAPQYRYSYESKNGKHIISEMYKSKGKNYKETFHGVKLLKQIRLSRCASCSQSAQEFIQNFTDECWWIQFE